jgi:hypothetical protein
MLKIRYLFNFIFFFAFIYASDTYSQIYVQTYLNDKPGPSGTPEREEYEFKYAIKDNGKVSVKSIAKHIEETIKDISKKELFLFEKLVGKKYFLNDRFQAFVFKDYYYDTKNNDILNSNSALRMRYRWTSPQNHIFYNIFPFIKLFYPNRCEFQFKRNYTFPKPGFAKVYESRFEFRDASEPFINKILAPEAPWPFEEYQKYLLSGYYKNFKIAPVFNMIKVLSEKNTNEVKLEKKFECVTTRYRSHLNIETPWGTGPNPTHAFILTIDHTVTDKMKFYEIEIEIERNVSTAMNSMIDSDDLGNPIRNEAREFSKLAKNAVVKDLELIQEGLLNKISNNIETLPVYFKYQRLSKGE